MNCTFLGSHRDYYYDNKNGPVCPSAENTNPNQLHVDLLR